MIHPLVLIGFGVVVGIFAGVMGLGGGSIMIPGMVYAFALTQTQAHGTSLAVMALPVFIPAILEYHRHGNVDWRMALYIALGAAFGTFFGAYIANSLPKETLKLLFGLMLIYVAAYTVFGKENLLRTTALSTTLVAIALIMVISTRTLDARKALLPTITPADAPTTQSGE
ncbi:MAG TPA: sulfite exporter TauE/SafE family protein [Tepidisphaeraceae bacterium]|nr:sulfite exporter TauE/SafE family protein [Tepidisphaeraceae bacterium]